MLTRPNGQTSFILERNRLCFLYNRMFPLIFPDGVIEEIVSYLIGLDNKPLVKFLMDYIKKENSR